jgi:hypothetical protein
MRAMAARATYLERYLAGEHQQVWAELVTCGAQVREEPLYSDAWAVACVTMRRVRTNIERFIPRLVHIGFTFGYDRILQWALHEPIQVKDWRGYLELLEWSRAEPPVFLPARLAEEHRADIVALGLDDIGPEMFELGVEAPDMRANIDQLERLAGPLPLSLRAWYTEVGAVNFFGYHPEWTRLTWLPEHFTSPRMPPADRYLMTECDPLQVCVLDSVRMDALRNKHAQGRLHQFEFAADRYFKDFTAGSSSPYFFGIPDSNMDATLTSYEPHLTFTEYLRRCIRWGGFPGMEEWESTPEADLSFVTEGMVFF